MVLLILLQGKATDLKLGTLQEASAVEARSKRSFWDRFTRRTRKAPKVTTTTTVHTRPVSSKPGPDTYSNTAANAPSFHPKATSIEAQAPPLPDAKSLERTSVPRHYQFIGGKRLPEPHPPGPTPVVITIPPRVSIKSLSTHSVPWDMRLPRIVQVGETTVAGRLRKQLLLQLAEPEQEERGWYDHDPNAGIPPPLSSLPPTDQLDWNLYVSKSCGVPFEVSGMLVIQAPCMECWCLPLIVPWIGLIMC